MQISSRVVSMFLIHLPNGSNVYGARGGEFEVTGPV